MIRQYLYLAVVWLHILSALVWIGGAAFIALVLVPALRRPDFRGLAPSLLRAAALRFRAVGWVSLALLVLTGTTMLALRGLGTSAWLDGSLFDGRFGRILAVKLSLVAAILALSGVHDFLLGPRAAAVILRDPESAEAARARRIASWMGRITLLLGLGVVAAAVVLVRGY